MEMNYNSIDNSDKSGFTLNIDDNTIQVLYFLLKASHSYTAIEDNVHIGSRIITNGAMFSLCKDYIIEKYKEDYSISFPVYYEMCKKYTNEVMDNLDTLMVSGIMQETSKLIASHIKEKASLEIRWHSLSVTFRMQDDSFEDVFVKRRKEYTNENFVDIAYCGTSISMAVFYILKDFLMDRIDGWISFMEQEPFIADTYYKLLDMVIKEYGEIPTFEESDWELK